MFGVHWAYIVLLLVVVLIIFGPGRLPELGGAVGRAMREFRKATTDITNEITTATATQAKPDQPAQPVQPASGGDAAPVPSSETKPPSN